MPFLESKKQLASLISAHFSLPEFTEAVAFSDLGMPPDSQLGHLAMPCFRLAKSLKRPADVIAKTLCETINGKTFQGTATGPYANFRIPTSTLYSSTISRVLTQRDAYGADSSGKGQNVVIEYCSPNIAKSLGFQHIRTTLIGNALANIYEFQGFKTVRLNFIGDWGTQFARLLAAFALWGDKAKLGTPETVMPHLLDLYVRFHKDAENDPGLLEKSSVWLKRLEERDPNAWDLWKLIRKASVDSMDLTLSRMNIVFDRVEGESQYIDSIEQTLEQVKSKASAQVSEGAWIVELDGISTPALIQKRDGTTLYLTRDIAAAIDRKTRLHFDTALYVVSDQQRLHFQQLFATLKKMGFTWSKTLSHVGFGTVLFGLEKMSTRQGKMVLMDEFLDEAQRLALAECTAKNPGLNNKESVAQKVGLGAVIFGQLSSHRTRDIQFDWKTALALDGDTGPYVQYSFVRCRSLLAKSSDAPEAKMVDTFAPEEDALILQIARLRAEVEKARRENEPFYIANYLLDLAKAFNRFYFKLPVLQCSDQKLKAMRLSLVAATQIALQNGLRLLGIPCPEEM